jgi:ribosomal protein S18 acetylase RimI-like enzyme
MPGQELPQEFRFVDLSQEDYQRHWNEWGPRIFDENSTNLDTRKILSDEEKAGLRELQKNTAQLIRMNIGIFKGDQLCGWFSGDQYNYETFYMRNSAVLPEFRRQGLYTALLREALRRVEGLGFQIVFSRHNTTNSAILIPKLKAGFMVTALEVSDRFGTLVHLSYFFNQARRKVMEFRSGDLKPDGQLKEAMGLS